MQGQQSSQSSFFAMIYEELIPADHLLRRLPAAVDFSFVPDLVSAAIAPIMAASRGTPWCCSKPCFCSSSTTFPTGK
jgi:hypothetical protein